MKTAVACASLALGSALVVNPRGRTTRLQAAVTSEEEEVVAVNKDLSGVIPDCPATLWDSQGIDIEAARKQPATGKGCPLEWTAPEGSSENAAAWFEEKREDVHEKLREHGAIWFKGFDLMKSEDGFRSFYEALDLDPCLDPIHTSGLRKFASAPDAIYEEVNKPSLRQHFIGLHQESTHRKTATYGAFVCFKPATVKGGEFFVADAAKILRELDLDVAKRIYDKKIRISVSNLDLNFLDVPGLKEPLMDGVKNLVDKLVAPKFDMGLEMVYGADGKPMRLQAVEEVASPINRHPVTKEPLWFCNIHNHARYLRDRRPCTVPEVGMTEVYYGDLSPIPGEDLDHINEVSQRNMVNMLMQPGDVLLLDNYRVLHGRDVFEGDRYHAVSWFGGRKSQAPDRDEDEASKPGNLLNGLVNKFLVDSF